MLLKVAYRNPIVIPMQHHIVDEFAALVAPQVEDENIDLLRGALTIARTAYPQLDSESCVTEVDRLAGRVRQTVGSLQDARTVLSAINQVLFVEEGFRGNRDDYYDPRNSYLNDVLRRRLGIPITLSIVYMEVAHRVGVPVFGVGMPGHFLLKHYDVTGQATFIDAYDSGVLLSAAECEVRLNEVYGGKMTLQPQFLNTVRKRQILTRMLNNLRQIFLTVRQYRKTLMVIDLILAIHPRSPDDLRQRALLRYNEGMLRPAAEDLDEYVKIAPDASDADEMKETALAIRRAIAMMN